MCEALTAYAREHGGRFLLFGSAARGTMRYDSDVDILVDFPPDTLDHAWNFAERACWDRRLDPDILPFAWARLVSWSGWRQTCRCSHERCSMGRDRGRCNRRCRSLLSGCTDLS
ncbi:MAG: nucleotidyltransferase domain-containing protein [Acetobacteraceae bacterium]|nr:nucleotidyltransferase domain-containing protein [Acetobacteraceae bacterium]